MRSFEGIKRIVIKIGSSSLVKKNLSINEPMLVGIMQSLKKIIDNGYEVALVTSGAIAIGMHALGLTKKPNDMAIKQACAAVGQAKLMEAYNKAAGIYELKTGQILLNHDDFQIRKRMNYLSQTLSAMFDNGIIPIINENDALAVEEIKVGDNDTLAALIAPMINADLLILFSDIDGLFNKNPKLYNDAIMLNTVDNIDDEILSMIGDATTNIGTGGMITKINAAVIATMAGCNMIICNSNKIGEIPEIINGEEIGTLFKAKRQISSLEHFIIFRTNSLGTIIVDDGLAKKLLGDQKVSILPKGIIDVKGSFLENSIVEIRDNYNNLLAKGICKYSSDEVRLLSGHNTKDIDTILGYHGKKEIIHANDLVVIREKIYERFIK